MNEDRATENLAAMLAHLAAYRYACLSEAALVSQVTQVLQLHGYEFEREFSLAVGGRLDYYLPRTRLFIECKVDQSWAKVVRQLGRYCEANETSGGLLISRRNAHRDLPATINGKPIASLWVGQFAI